MNRLNSIHPGEILREEFLEPLGVSQYRLARETGVPPRRINEIVLEKRAITADTALRLARFFGTSELFWLNLQARHDLDVQRTKLGSTLAAVQPLASVGETRRASADTSRPAARTPSDRRAGR